MAGRSGFRSSLIGKLAGQTAKYKKKRGRPKLYGAEVLLKSLLADIDSMQVSPRVVYGETEGTLRYRMRDLLWRPTGRLVRFVAVVR